MQSATAEKKSRFGLLAGFLLLPALVPYVCHLWRAWKLGARPTGFLIYDMAYYMANAREHFDGGFHLFYGLPFSPFYATPRIYFQPQTLFLGVLWKVTGWDPGIVFFLFGVAAAILCAFAAVKLYEEVVRRTDLSARLGLVVLFWGGGLLWLAGLLYYTLRGPNTLAPNAMEALFSLDPFQGFWFMNFGRNLIFPTEAYYHALFLFAVTAVLRSRYSWALLPAAILSASHPFTGAELLLILGGWACFERWFIRNKTVPLSFIAGCSSLLLLHAGYYILWLRTSAEYRSVMQQWTLAFLVQAQNFVPAYLLVGLLAFWAMRNATLARDFFSNVHNRFFLIWFLIVFALSNHEFAIQPIQPAHFTRGYDWLPLFLMGVGPLLGLFDFIRVRFSSVARAALLAGVVGVLLSDNILWLATYPLRSYASESIVLSPEKQEVFKFLNDPQNAGSLVVAAEPEIGYLTTVYTPLRSWRSHPANTPFVEDRWKEIYALFQEGQFTSAWKRRRLLIIASPKWLAKRGAAWAAEHRVRPVFSNNQYGVFLADDSNPAQTIAR